MKPSYCTISATLFAVVALLTLSSVSLNAQTIMNRDAAIEKAVGEVSVENMKSLVSDLLTFHTRNNLSSNADPSKGVRAAADYLYKKASSYISQSGGRLSVEKVYYTAGGTDTRLGREVRLCNVVATISGSDKADNRVIAILAHFDSRAFNGNDSTSYAPGANDNGSGVACLMEMVRLISTVDIPITLKVMFLSGEEHGLLGADHMAKLAKSEGWNLMAVINNDMIGNSNASETNTQTNTVLRVFSENIPATETEEQRKVRTYNSAENDSYSRQLARYIKEVGERYVDNMTVKLVYRNDRFGRGGDHTPFCCSGFTAVRICEVNENYNRTHQLMEERNGIRYGDELWAVDFEYVRKNTEVNLASALNMALAPSVPENVKLLTSGLSNFSELTWEAPKQGKTPVAYYVLVRETDQPNWQKKILVRATNAKLPYSKDNYFFAVQSVDSEGHESLAVFANGGGR